jgi:serine/threonine-protein kinase
MERMGEYLVRRLVGEGGMGKVYEAEERLSHRRVALKVLRPELAESEQGRRLFLNEMAIMAQLDHPNVVRCLACIEVDDRLVMVLEYLEGRTLRSRLSQRRPLPWDEAVDIAVQVAAALAAAHRAEPAIVHRDLKPENVMLLADGSVKVMDFGIAKVVQALSKTTTHSVGTLQYMSPEQIDAKSIDARSDLYALGLLLYEMLTGKPPFESPSPRELLEMQCTRPPAPLEGELKQVLPEGVERLLFELLEKHPDDRPGSAADVLHELEPVLATGGVARSAPPAPTPARPSTPPQSGTAPAPSSGRPEPTVPTSARPIAAKPAEVPLRTGLLIVVLLSLIAGLATFVARAATSDGQPEPAATAQPPREIAR